MSYKCIGTTTWLLQGTWLLTYTLRPVLTCSNDGLNLRAVAMGDALAHGQAVIKANKRMEWGMAMGQHQPRILWARIAQVHEDAEVGQVAVRFDTNQVSLPRFSNAHTWDQKTDG